MRALGLVAALAFAAWLSPAPALAITFLLDSGDSIEGAIIDATRNTVIIRPRLGGLRQVPVGRLEQLEVTTADGQKLRGRYHGWIDGRCGIEVGTELLWLEDDRVVVRSSLAGPAVAEIPPPEPIAAPSAPAAAPPAQARTIGGPGATIGGRSAAIGGPGAAFAGPGAAGHGTGRPGLGARGRCGDVAAAAGQASSRACRRAGDRGPARARPADRERQGRAGRGEREVR